MPLSFSRNIHIWSIRFDWWSVENIITTIDSPHLWWCSGSDVGMRPNYATPTHVSTQNDDDNNNIKLETHWQCLRGELMSMSSWVREYISTTNHQLQRSSTRGQEWHSAIVHVIIKSWTTALHELWMCGLIHARINTYTINQEGKNFNDPSTLKYKFLLSISKVCFFIIILHI